MDMYPRRQTDEKCDKEQIRIAVRLFILLMPSQHEPNDESSEEEARVARFSFDCVKPKSRAEGKCECSDRRRSIDGHAVERRLRQHVPQQDHPYRDEIEKRNDDRACQRVDEVHSHCDIGEYRYDRGDAHHDHQQWRSWRMLHLQEVGCCTMFRDIPEDYGWG